MTHATLRPKENWEQIKLNEQGIEAEFLGSWGNLQSYIPTYSGLLKRELFTSSESVLGRKKTTTTNFYMHGCPIVCVYWVKYTKQ